MNPLTKAAYRSAPGAIDWVIVIAMLATLGSIIAWAICQWVTQ